MYCWPPRETTRRCTSADLSRSVDGLSRTHLASFDIATGKLATAFPALGINGYVSAISRAGTSIYIGGSFTLAGGRKHARLAKLNLVGTGYWVARLVGS